MMRAPSPPAGAPSAVDDLLLTLAKNYLLPFHKADQPLKPADAVFARESLVCIPSHVPPTTTHAHTYTLPGVPGVPNGVFWFSGIPFVSIVNAYVCVCVCACACVHAHMRVYIYVPVCMCAYTLARYCIIFFVRRCAPLVAVLAPQNVMRAYDKQFKRLFAWWVLCVPQGVLVT